MAPTRPQYQLLGRWGGDTVKRYLADSHLDTASRRAASLAQPSMDLEELITRLIKKELSVDSLGGPPDLAARTHLEQEVVQAERIAASAAGQLVTPKWVTNLSSGIAHRILPLSPAGLSEFAHCGWHSF